MKHTIILTISLLALIGTTSYFMLASGHKEVSAEEQRATFAEWQQCRRDNQYNPFCNQYKDNELNKPCLNTQAQVSYCQNSNKYCQSFYIYFEEPQEDKPLPDCFYKCANACQVYSTGDQFYEQNYDIENKLCAYVH